MNNIWRNLFYEKQTFATLYESVQRNSEPILIGRGGGGGKGAKFRAVHKCENQHFANETKKMCAELTMTNSRNYSKAPFCAIFLSC